MLSKVAVATGLGEGGRDSQADELPSGDALPGTTRPALASGVASWK